MPTWRQVTYAAGSGAVVGAITARFPKQIARGGFRAAKVGLKLGFKVGRVGARVFGPAAVAFVAFQGLRRGITVGRQRGAAAGIEAGIATSVSEATLGLISESQAIRVGRAAGAVTAFRFGTRRTGFGDPGPPLRFDFAELSTGLAGLFSPLRRGN